MELFIPAIPSDLLLDVCLWGECILPNGLKNKSPCFYLAQEGDTFTDISYRVLGTEDYAELIKSANLETNGKPKGDMDQNGIIDVYQIHLVIPKPPDY